MSVNYVTVTKNARLVAALTAAFIRKQTDSRSKTGKELGNNMEELKQALVSVKMALREMDIITVVFE